jgi:hypothetical protein
MANSTVRRWTRLGLLVLLLGTGCARKTRPLNEQVEGTVKLDGVPVAQVHVEFIPDEGPETVSPSSTGTTDDQGHYSLTCNNLKPGAVVGPHRVVIKQGRTEGRRDLDDPPGGKAGGGTPRKSAPTVPAVYGIAGQSPLRVEVTADQHTYDLQLSRNAAPAK